MFSFPRPGCVETGTPGHAYVFDSQSGESYIFLDNLAAGAQSKVQLVANISTREVVVRKVSRHKPPRRSANSCEQEQDREVRIVSHLNALLAGCPAPRLQDHPALEPAPLPRWASCLSHEDIPTTTPGPRPRPAWTRVSYWKLYNGGSLADWLRIWAELEPERPPPQDDGHSPSHRHYPPPFPTSVIARCVAQVSETLHFMYTAGAEPVYHCDLHLGNVFVHFGDVDGAAGGCDEHRDPPDFYIGDFGWARTASEALADTAALYGEEEAEEEGKEEKEGGRSSSNSNSSGGGRGFESFSAPPGAAPPGQRRRWDMARFGDALQSLVRMAVRAPARGRQGGDQPGVAGLQEESSSSSSSSSPSELAGGLERLGMMLRWLDDQDALLAWRNPHSRPPSLAALIREARQLERAALAVERDTAHYRLFMTLGRDRARAVQRNKRPHVCPAHPSTPPHERKVRARDYGTANIEGPWCLIESI